MLTCSSHQIKGRNGCAETLISFWIRSLINHEYGSVTNADYRWAKIKAHKVWKICTFLIFKRNCTVQQVLKVVT